MGRPLAFAAAAVALGALLLAACEVVYIRDFYGGALRRMNTVFKFYYQAWLLFAVGGGLSAFWLLRRLRFSAGAPWWGWPCSWAPWPSSPPRRPSCARTASATPPP